MSNALILRSYSHGVLWKIFALASKALFVFYYVQTTLPQGVFFEFSLILTVGALGARVFSFGFEDLVPAYLGKSPEDVGIFFYIFLSWLVFNFTVFIFAVNSKYEYSLYLLSVVGYTATFVHLGILRSIKPWLGEFLADALWPTFVIVAIGLAETSLNALVITFFGINILLNLLILSLNYKKFILKMPTISRFRNLLISGFDKVYSNFLLVLNMRGLVLASAILTTIKDDRLATLVAFGEAVWQLSMTVVYRNYNHYCKQDLISAHKRLKRSALMFTFVSLSIVAVIDFFIRIPSNKYTSIEIFSAIFYYILLAMILDLRYLKWAFSASVAPINSIFLVSSISSFISVVLVPREYWFCVSLIILIASYTFVSQRHVLKA